VEKKESLEEERQFGLRGDGKSQHSAPYSKKKKTAERKIAQDVLEGKAIYLKLRKKRKQGGVQNPSILIHKGQKNSNGKKVSKHSPRTFYKRNSEKVPRNVI